MNQMMSNTSAETVVVIRGKDSWARVRVSAKGSILPSLKAVSALLSLSDLQGNGAVITYLFPLLVCGQNCERASVVLGSNTPTAKWKSPVRQSILSASIRLPSVGSSIALLGLSCSCLVLIVAPAFSFISPSPLRLRSIWMCIKRYSLCVIKIVFTLQVLPLNSLFDKYDLIKLATHSHEVSYQLNKWVLW